MRVIDLTLTALLTFFSGTAQGTESATWWDICNSCSSESDFRARAVRIPTPLERVYISNSLTNETRRFQRTIVEDDLRDGHSLTILANEQPLTAQEAQAFHETIENAGTLFMTVPRNALDAFSGLSGRDSVVGDLTSGRLSGGLLSGLRTYLRVEGYQGAASDVSSATELDFLIVTYNLSVKLDGVRTQPLTVRITYPDGSITQIRLDKDLNQVLLVSAVDAEGNEIAFDQNDSNSDVVPPLGVEYVFGTTNQGWVDTFRASLDALDGYSCSSWGVTEDNVAVRCQRP